MLHPIINTRPTHAGRHVALVLSTAVHVVVLVVAMAPKPTSSWSAGEVVHPKPQIERISFVDVARTREPDAKRSRDARDVVRPSGAREVRPTRVPGGAPIVRALVPAINTLPIGPIAIAELPAIKEVELSARVSDSGDFQPVRLADAVKGIVNSVGKGPKTGPYAAEQVDKVVTPFSNNPKPIYPRSLERAGVEGSFIVHFVVDSTGRVDEKSVEFPSDANSMFIESVRRALRRSRYHPAELGGERVMQLVQQQFSFIIINRR